MSFVKKQLVLAFLFLIFGLSAVHAQTTPPPTPTPILTPVQATQFATTFCANLNVSGGTASAVYAPTPANSANQNYYWLPCWQVSFKDAVGLRNVVEVVDANGSVASYHNYTLSQQSLANNAPAGASTTATVAAQNATAALQAAAMPSDIALTPTTTNLQITEPATSAGNLWVVSWRRQFGAVPYEREQVTVILQAQTGVVQSLRKSFPSAPPISNTVSITSSQAINTAQNQLTQLGITTAVFKDCVQTVGQPNTKWQPGGSQIPLPNCAGRIVWDCVYADSIDSNASYSVWIDAATGSVVGGQTYTTAQAKSGLRNTMTKSFKLQHRKN